MCEFYKLTVVILAYILVPVLLLSFLTTLTPSGQNDAFSNSPRERDGGYVITEENFKQSDYLGNCCLIAGMAALPGNAELLNRVVPPSGRNFRLGRFEFNIYKLGKLHQVAIGVKSLPRTSGISSGEMIGPLLEKAFVDLHFDGDYADSWGIPPSYVTASLTDGFFEEFTNVAVDFGFEINEVIRHGLKTKSPMTVSFAKVPGSKLEENHCYTLLGVDDGAVKVFNPYGS